MFWGYFLKVARSNQSASLANDNLGIAQQCSTVLLTVMPISTPSVDEGEVHRPKEAGVQGTIQPVGADSSPFYTRLPSRNEDKSYRPRPVDRLALH